MTTPYTIKVGGTAVSVVAGTLDVTNEIGQRSTCTFQVEDPPGTLVLNQGTQVQIYDDTSTLIYGGFVEQDTVTRPGWSPFLIHSVTTKDYHYLADKRLAFNSYLNQTAGFIVYDLLNNYLSSEGVTATSSSIATGVTLPEAVFTYEPVSKCIDALAQSSGYWWEIDENKVLWFQPYTGRNAPWVLDGTQMDNQDESSISVQWGNPQYVNRQFVTGGFDKTNSLTERRYGDGSSRAFTMSYEFASDKATVALNGVSQTVSVKGSTGAQWYYAEGDAVLAQDSSQTILSTSDYIDVTYKGRYPIVALAQSGAQIVSQQTLEGGGTGYVESKEHNSKIKTLSGAFQIASSLLAHYGQPVRTLTFQTMSKGLKQGQLLTIQLPQFNLVNQQFLIRSVEISDTADNYNIWFTVTTVGSPYDVTWQSFFQTLSNQGQSIDAVNVGDGSALAILTQWQALFNWAATFSLTQHSCPICSTSTLCGNSTIIC